MVTKELIESDKKKVEIVRETYPQWERTWLNDEQKIEEHTKCLIQSIETHLNCCLHGDWGGIRYGILPTLYTEWLKQQGITL